MQLVHSYLFSGMEKPGFFFFSSLECLIVLVELNKPGD